MDDLAAHERRLQRSARRRAGAAGDGELDGLFRHISARRARRGADPIAGGDAPRHGAGGEILDVEAVGASVRVFRVARAPGFEFRAGQYVKVGVEGVKPQDLSIATAPHEAHLELCVELRPGGRLTPRMFALGAGDRLELGERAKGGFGLDESARRHLMVATVTGIAPLRSMLRDALHRGLADEIVVLHGASYADELPYREELTTLAATDRRVRYEPTVSRPGEAANRGWGGHRGRVDALAEQTAAALDPRSTAVYVAGNAGMVDNVSTALGTAGFEVRTEAY